MTRKLTRSSLLSVVAPFVAMLTLLIAAAVLAQVDGRRSVDWEAARCARGAGC